MVLPDRWMTSLFIHLLSQHFFLSVEISYGFMLSVISIFYPIIWSRFSPFLFCKNNCTIVFLFLSLRVLGKHWLARPFEV